MQLLLFFAALVLVTSANPVIETRKWKTTADRIFNHGYPVEEHTVQTSDAYILTMFRIPYSPKLENENRPKPVVFLQHGLLSSSDCWILNGPNDALAFRLADEGYDVWLGNARGNVYSREHAKKTPLLPPFWDFTWHEIGIYDLPAMIDYVLYMTDEDSVHYVGHSQGTTAFFVMLSEAPYYNDKIKTSHMLAPVAYMENMDTPLAKVCGPLLGHPSILSDLIGSNEFMPNNKFLSMLGSQTCRDTSPFQDMCANVLFLIAGWNSEHLNYTLLQDIVETHPAGSSSSQLIHYLQEYESALFRQFDHGKKRNKKQYGQKNPPEYQFENICPETPIQLIYASNDWLAADEDVERLADELGDCAELQHVEHLDFNHLDFLWAEDVLEVINEPVIAGINEYEASQ